MEFKGERADGMEEVYDEPVSPTGQYFNSSVLSICILAALESDIPIDTSQTNFLLNTLFIPINPRFSSIMVKDEHGVKQWKKVDVKLEDHVHVPIFPDGLSPESYDDYLQEYLSKIAMERLPQSRPLWEIHLIKYPTSNAAGTIVFKLHHALGDGFSLMGALFSCLRRADNPSLPLTFPSSKQGKSSDSNRDSFFKKVTGFLSRFLYTTSDFAWSILKSSFVEDDRTPIRSGHEWVELRPINISTVTFSLDQIKQIKDKLGGTINDVITGIIFYGTRLYMQISGPQDSINAHSTALVLLNTRVINNYLSLKEMSKPDSKSPWGNQFGFLHVSIPDLSADVEMANPIDFVYKGREIIQRKRGSLAVYLTGRLLEMMRKLRGPETTAQYVHRTLKNSSMTISNMIGPMEQMSLADHPARGMYFMVVGVPQSLTITMVSYMGKLKVAVGVEKDFINEKLYISCLEKAFTRIFKAAVVSP
ncbi:wax ester synthase/diacylglycerol acyltransferase 4-like [Macadamia integrifolia]|uniref:wax ester synthase/diacylglycerol acyltransferase 4-like n=1 Tax=Macadamia integrifolia TaxID=60698 RepID=UPI001C502775|nr:wax ester synthase/diacylglycerol acyltransferase 4-like [Macadamia integrifolia]